MKYFLVPALLLLLVSSVCAQSESADVLGTVRDVSGSAIPNAIVTLVNQDTGLQVKATSDETGSFTFSNVKIGRYTLSAEAPGFAKEFAKDVKVDVNARQRVDFTMQVGQVRKRSPSRAPRLLWKPIPAKRAR